MIMNFVDIVTGFPITLGVSVIANVAAVAGYYFFVIPMIDEKKKTADKMTELEDELDHFRENKRRDSDLAIDKILKSQVEINSALTKLESASRTDPNREIQEVLKMLERMEDGLNDSDPKTLTALLELKSTLTNLSEHVNNARTHDGNMNNMMNEIIRFLHTISDKQSQIIGALLGMSRIQDRNRSI